MLSEKPQLWAQLSRSSKAGPLGGWGVGGSEGFQMVEAGIFSWTWCPHLLGPPTTRVLSALSQQPPPCPAQTWHMGPCPHQAVTPMGLGRLCPPRAAHPPSGQQPPKLGPQVSMGPRPWGRWGRGPRGACMCVFGGGGSWLSTAWLCSSLWTQTSVDDMAAGPLPGVSCSTGLAHPLFSPSHLASKTPPPLYLAADGRRPDLPGGLAGARGGLSTSVSRGRSARLRGAGRGA